VLSAQKQYQDAMNLVVQSLEEWPNSLELMYLKSQLELNLSGPEVIIKIKTLCVLTKKSGLYGANK
jgi:hypothetical protein